jgi:hypothetical protein
VLQMLFGSEGRVCVLALCHYCLYTAVSLYMHTTHTLTAVSAQLRNTDAL